MSYLAPTRLDDALDLMAAGPVQIVAGCTDHFPARDRHSRGGRLLDVTGIAELQGLDHDGSGWRIGAATRWADLARAKLPPAFAGLQAAAGTVGSLQIQNSGTVGGNLCNASPAADGMPPLLTLEAKVEIAGPLGRRCLPLSDFVLGPRRVALDTGEIVTAVLIPDPPDGAQGAFQKLGARRYLVISIAMTAVVIGLSDSGRITHARIAVGACSPVARRLIGLEGDLVGQRPAEIEITPEHLSELTPIDDPRASAAYRLHAAREQVLRAVQAATNPQRGAK